MSDTTIEGDACGSAPAKIIPGTVSPSDEHRTDLAAKFAALVADLAKLGELDRSDLEPATPWPWHEDHDVSR